MELTHPNSTLSLFDTTKEERNSFVRATVQSIVDGNEDPLKIHLQVKCMEEIIKTLTSDLLYKEHLLDAAHLHGKKFTYRNSEINVMETGVTYDYSNCGDSVIEHLHKELDGIKERVKQREEFLKALPSNGMTMVDEETGEVSKMYPPVKRSTTSVTVRLK